MVGSPGRFGCGTPATPAEIADWDIDVRGTDGAGPPLPPGQGKVSRDADVFARQCAPATGPPARAKAATPSSWAARATLTVDRPEPSVGRYRPFAPTPWDYINWAMPFPSPHTLSADDVYALTAYILNFNNIVPADFAADRNSLPKVKMPNRDNFTWKDPRPDTGAVEGMKNCVDPQSVKIISRAEGKDLTPRTMGPLDTMQGN